MTRSTPSTPPPHSLSDEDKGSPRLRRSPRIKLGVEVIEKKKGVRSGKKNKVSKNSVPCKTIKVKPNLGRAAGSKEDPPLGDKKTKEAVSTRRVEQDKPADSEEDSLGEDNGDDGGKVRSVNKNHKVSKNDVPCKTNKVKPNLGRAAGSREDPPRGDKKSKEAVSTRRVEQDELADSEEDGLGEDDGDDDADKDNDDGGADDDDNSDNDDADYHSEEGEGESDDEDEIEDGQDPMLESDQGDSSDDEEIKRTDKDRRGTTALFSQQKFRDYVKKVKSSRNQERELTKKPRLTRERNPSCGAANSFLYAVFVACATFNVACVLNITCDRIQEVQQLLCQKETVMLDTPPSVVMETMRVHQSGAVIPSLLVRTSARLRVGGMTCEVHRGRGSSVCITVGTNQNR
jgi:hypothetical protein